MNLLTIVLTRSVNTPLTFLKLIIKFIDFMIHLYHHHFLSHPIHNPHQTILPPLCYSLAITITVCSNFFIIFSIIVFVAIIIKIQKNLINFKLNYHQIA